jgi:hypothetical protein
MIRCALSYVHLKHKEATLSQVDFEFSQAIYNKGYSCMMCQLKQWNWHGRIQNLQSVKVTLSYLSIYGTDMLAAWTRTDSPRARLLARIGWRQNETRKDQSETVRRSGAGAATTGAGRDLEAEEAAAGRTRCSHSWCLRHPVAAK